MMRSPKRRLVQTLVLLVAIWPAVHYLLAARFQFDPWELFGWAMYALPQARYEIALEGEANGVAEAFVPAGPIRKRHFEVARHRALLGRLFPLDDYAARLFERYPRYEAIVIVERRWFLDHETARLDYRDTRLRFLADEVRGPLASSVSGGE